MLARPVVRNVAQSVARGLTLSPLGGLDAAIRALFSDGIIYDPSDLSTLYQDSAGTTPITALEQPVGLMLDKSRGLVLGAELVTNGDFSDGATGWSLTGAAASQAVSGGVLTVTRGSSATYTTATIATVVGKTYQLSVDVVSYTQQPVLRVSATLGGSENYSVTYTSTGNKKAIFTATATTTYVSLYAPGAPNDTTSWDNISVRELPGYHAFHTPGDTTTRPTVSRRINLLTKTESFDDAAWAKTRINPFGSGSVANTTATLDPLGANTADFVQEDTTASSSHLVQQSTAGTIGQTETFSVHVKPAGRSWILLAVGAGATAYFNITDGAKGTVSGGTAEISSAGNGWYKCSLTATRTTNLNNIVYLASANGSVNYTGDGTSGIYIWGASLVPADLASLPYQRVNTTTDYDTSSIYPTFLRTDGVNDSLQTNAIDFTGTDKMFVGAAVRKLSDAATGVLVETSSDFGSNNGAFAIRAPRVAGSPQYNVGLRITAAGSVDSATYTAPLSNVLSAQLQASSVSIPDAIATRINGSTPSSLTQTGSTPGTGNFGNHKLYLFMRAGTSLPANIWFYGGLIKGATLSASQVALSERWLASKTKTVVLA